MIKSMVSIPLDMRVDVLDKIDRGPGRETEYLVNWTECGFTWISQRTLDALEQLFAAWNGPPRD